MTRLEDEIDTVFNALNDALERHDLSAEAMALTHLSQSLEESDRFAEAESLHEQAVRVACGPAVRYAQAQLLMKRGLAQAAPAAATTASWTTAPDPAVQGTTRQRALITRPKPCPARQAARAKARPDTRHKP